jgi:TetR/AcrR family transcriptional regulator, regulator of cefoperazone and chloramphenicol sensitivity
MSSAPTSPAPTPESESESERLWVSGVSVDDLSTRARIRELALRLFAENGIRSTSLRAVAAAAGVSPSLVVHHFKTKAGLEHAVHEDVIGRMLKAVHGVGTGEPLSVALVSRRNAFEELLRDHIHLADYLSRVVSEGGETSLTFFQDSLAIVRSEMDALVDAGLARPMQDPDVEIVLYWVLVNARFLIRPHLEAALGLDLSKPADIERLHQAEISLLTSPLFPDPAAG